MKLKITENQNDLIKRLQLRQKIKEMEFLAQQTPVNMGESQQEHKNHYTVDVTIFAAPTRISDVELDTMDDRTYWNALIEDVKDTLKDAFQTAEIEINSISTQARGTKH